MFTAQRQNQGTTKPDYYRKYTTHQCECQCFHKKPDEKSQRKAWLHSGEKKDEKGQKRGYKVVLDIK
jgi:hypothetical protein